MTKPTDGTPNSERNRIDKRNKVDSIHRAYIRYQKNIFWNSAYRILTCFLLLFGVLFLAFALRVSIQTSNWTYNLIIFAMFVFLIFFPLRYIWTNYNQLSYEMEVNKSISSLKWRIKRLSEPSEKKNYRSLQAGITELRRNLVGYLVNSEIVSLPVPNFELNRLRKRIDIFCNCASEALVPIDKVFSVTDRKYEEYYQIHLEEYREEREKEKQSSELQRKKTGYFNSFDLLAMDEFLDHLWDVLFDKEIKSHGILSYKHPVNLTLVSQFFKYWNNEISRCKNCQKRYKIISDDIETYYESVNQLANENRQRRWKLRDDAIIVIVSVSLSTLIQYVIGL